MINATSGYINPRIDFGIDSSVNGAFYALIESELKTKNIFSINRAYIIEDTSLDNILDYFLNNYDVQYRAFNGKVIYIWNDHFLISIYGTLYSKNRKDRFDNDVCVTGDRRICQDIIDGFDNYFANKIIPEHHTASMIVKGSHGLDKVSLPMKLDRKFYPELYPCIENPNQFIDDFISSPANVLILTGPAGLGKSAMINEIILRAAVPTSIVFDVDVMREDRLYTDFITQSLRNEGGLMIMEDSDVILSDRVASNNDMMSKLLNLSDGIVDTSGAKFVFSANLKGKAEIDTALTRPGRCFDVVEFRNLTYDEAVIATEAINRPLYMEKKEYTVAELFTGISNRKEAKRKVGFI